MIQQAQINQEILTCFSVVESALNWISKHQEALVTHQQLTCDPGFAKLCITRLPWNSNQYSWSDIQYHRRGASSTNLKGQIDKLQLELHQQLQDIQRLTKQEVFQTLHDDLSWLNLKTWFDELNLRMWVFGATDCLLILIMLCVLHCIWKLFSQSHVRDQQVASFVGSIAVLTKNKGGRTKMAA